jgi:geranylgeranyl reductase family protein
MSRPDAVDVIVVGAGPAGSAAAYHLSRAGLDVLAVDRATFPRDKVCGDGLTPRAVAALIRMGVDVADEGFLRIDASRVHGADGRPMDVGWRGRALPGFGMVRRRFELDHMLVERARAAGVTVLEGVEAAGPVMESGRVVGVRLRTDGEPSPAERVVRARFVVAADGASTRLAARAGGGRDPSAPTAVAARRYYRVDGPTDPVFETWIGIKGAGRRLPGYGWAFPTGDGATNVGAFVIRPGRAAGGASPDGALSARAAFDAFITDLSALSHSRIFAEEDALGPITSSAIPIGMDRLRTAVSGLLVVGDAAGLANPFTGEGIGYALESGELAARAIVAATRGGADVDPAVECAAALRSRYGRVFRAGRWFARQIGRPTVTSLAARYGTRVPVGSKAVIRFMIDAG